VCFLLLPTQFYGVVVRISSIIAEVVPNNFVMSGKRLMINGDIYRVAFGNRTITLIYETKIDVLICTTIYFVIHQLLIIYIMYFLQIVKLFLKSLLYSTLCSENKFICIIMHRFSFMVWRRHQQNYDLCHS
jgi:hypothetical protein